ncbi:MAG TPA: hypothetical protein VK533_00855 [Sphingomonas sp.]|uniref:hypothetical protein n=1 Tax=Sphingomonas sp. TaxID=28214 RepID=UPI002C171BD4|nr:hypothetical protein [Sphingomonas sp.]HMI18068.1 hypothetical protein [Sphingomonas sp.]
MGKLLGAALLAAGLAVSAAAQDVIGARTFVAQIYIKATHNRHFGFASLKLLTPDLYDLVQRGSRGGKTGGLDYDPICQCKDNDGLSAQILSVTGTENKAVAQVLLRFDADRIAPSKKLTFVLTRAPLAGWKIADIQTARVPSLRAWLLRRGGGGRRD